MSYYKVYDVADLSRRIRTMTLVEMVDEYVLVYNLYDDVVSEMHAFRGIKQFPVEDIEDAGLVLAERIAEVVANTHGYKRGEDGRFIKVGGVALEGRSDGATR